MYYYKMSLLPKTLLNSTSNEDQTLEIHSEILEPLSHSQKITRWEIPHKNVLDSDSQLIYKVYWNKMNGIQYMRKIMASARPKLKKRMSTKNHNIYTIFFLRFTNLNLRFSVYNLEFNI